MSVLKAFRNLSDMEFFKNAMYLRNDLTRWLLKDFGNCRKHKPIRAAIPNISNEDKEILNDIVDKYGIDGDRAYKRLYPEWFADFEREYLLEIMRDMMGNIVSANTIYITSDYEYDTRRNYQNKAIADCYKLYQELKYIITMFPSDLNYLTDILDRTEREIELLKGWRKSDVSTWKKIKKKKKESSFEKWEDSISSIFD